MLLWFTKGDEYTFNLDAVRVPSKYPGKTHFKGEKYGQPSGNPLGKNGTSRTAKPFGPSVGRWRRNSTRWPRYFSTANVPN